MTRLGLFGGTFDPVHLGHLIVAEQAREQLGLDRVLFIPAARSPFKPSAEPSEARQRAAMIELAIAGQPAFALDRTDLDRPAPSRTADTVALLRAVQGPAAELWWIVGADSLAGFPRWHRPEAILAEARLAVFDRPGHRAEPAALEARLPALRGRVDRLTGPPIGISATDIRLRLRQGRSIRYLVPPAVEAHLRQHHLYTVPEHRAARPEASPAIPDPAPPEPSMPELLIATGNAGKLREYRALLSGLDLDLLAPADLGLGHLDPAETGETFEQNAVLKARAFAAASGLPALADDSGIEVDALDGFPGVRSARWVPGSDAERVQALLERLRAVPDAERTARFRAVVALALPDGRLAAASGAVEGRIAHAPAGRGGFGYDPIFRVEDGGHHGELTSAELSPEEKNRLSHRARALQALLPQLQTLLPRAPSPSPRL